MIQWVINNYSRSEWLEYCLASCTHTTSAERRTLCFYLPSVCLSVRPLDYSKATNGFWWNFCRDEAKPKKESSWWSAAWSRSWNVFKDSFTYYCDYYGQPRIKHSDPRRRLELSECLTVSEKVSNQSTVLSLTTKHKTITGKYTQNTKQLTIKCTNLS